MAREWQKLRYTHKIQQENATYAYKTIYFAVRMSITLQQIQTDTGAKYTGNQLDFIINKASTLTDGDSTSLGFLSNPKYESQIYSSKCGIIFVPEDFKSKEPIHSELLYHPNPYFAFCLILTKYFNPNIHNSGYEEGSYIDPSAHCEAEYLGRNSYVDANATIGKGCKIYPGCYIGKGVKLGENCIIYPNVTIYSETVIGKDVIIHAGTVIGSDGFGFAPVNGRYFKIPQIGNVIIEDYVEIGSNCSIDRATLGNTIIKTGTKLDNLVQIAHNVEVGEHTVIASQTGIAGSTKIGGYSQFGGQVGIGGHLVIAPHTSAGGQAGITGNITESHQKLTGTPATDVREFLKGVAGSRRISEISKEIQQLKKEITELKKSQKK